MHKKKHPKPGATCCFPRLPGRSPRKRTPLVGAAYGTDWQNSKPAWPLSSRARGIFGGLFGSCLARTRRGCANTKSYVIGIGVGLMMIVIVVVDHDAIDDDDKR